MVPIGGRDAGLNPDRGCGCTGRAATMAPVPAADRKPELAIEPEPPEATREAIARALERPPGRPSEPAGRSAWWRAGVRESVAPPAADR